MSKRVSDIERTVYTLPSASTLIVVIALPFSSLSSLPMVVSPWVVSPWVVSPGEIELPLVVPPVLV